MPTADDIIGKVYNNLRVDSLTGQYNSYNRRLYSCTCLLCGHTFYTTKSNIVRGDVKDCGGHKSCSNISGIKYGLLRALYISHKGKHNKQIWHCRCDCGNYTNVTYGDLVSGNTTSCGCVQKSNLSNLYVEHVNIPKLLNPKIRVTNRSGVTGVSWDNSRQKWSAEIGFMGKKYRLGRYTDLKDAKAVRKRAEDHLYGDFLEWYNQYQEAVKYAATKD